MVRMSFAILPKSRIQRVIVVLTCLVLTPALYLLSASAAESWALQHYLDTVSNRIPAGTSKLQVERQLNRIGLTYTPAGPYDLAANTPMIAYAAFYSERLHFRFVFNKDGRLMYWEPHYWYNGT